MSENTWLFLEMRKVEGSPAALSRDWTLPNPKRWPTNCVWKWTTNCVKKEPIVFESEPSNMFKRTPTNYVWKLATNYVWKEGQFALHCLTCCVIYIYLPRPKCFKLYPKCLLQRCCNSFGEKPTSCRGTPRHPATRPPLGDCFDLDDDGIFFWWCWWYFS